MFSSERWAKLSCPSVSGFGVCCPGDLQWGLGRPKKDGRVLPGPQGFSLMGSQTPVGLLGMAGPNECLSG